MYFTPNTRQRWISSEKPARSKKPALACAHTYAQQPQAVLHTHLNPLITGQTV